VGALGEQRRDPAVARAGRRQVIAFRVAQQAADPTAGPLQDYPPGAAELSLALRGADARGLVRAWSLRGTAHLLAREALPVFTRGLLPVGEDELRAFTAGAGDDTLDAAGMSRTQVVAETRAAIAAALHERGPLTRDELHEELRRRLPPELLMWCSRCGSQHSPPKVWRAAALDGTYVFGPPRGRQATFAPAEPDRAAPVDELAAELVRTYLRWHGPSTPRELAGWAGVGPAQARRTWGLVEDELAEVDRAGERAWLLRADAAALLTASPPPGVMLAAAGDPLLTARDRTTLAPDEPLRRALFRPAGSPGAVLVDGELRGTWRARRSGHALLVETDVAGVRPEHAAHIAAVRGASRVEVKTQP
jgi:hypothetical protein